MTVAGLDDLRGLARAHWVNFKAGEVVQGGSTVTQQLAKVMYLSPERTLTRKMQEALLALRLDPALPAMKAIGVAELGGHLRGDTSLDEAVAAMKTMTPAMTLAGKAMK